MYRKEKILQAHFQTPHMAACRQVLPDVVAGQGAIYRYDVGECQSL
ncbi:MAG: hypothetical protein KDE34_25290 [Anaerolineales bacterium]|nr:hypothetical protein [Anaerolineales bacterium]